MCGKSCTSCVFPGHPQKKEVGPESQELVKPASFVNLLPSVTSEENTLNLTQILPVGGYP